MRLSESNMNAKINSEIHASLRRLEDADYVYNQVHSEDMALVIDQSNEADESLQQQINALTKEIYQLHSWVEPHVYLGDLQFFQKLYVGNLQVAEGGEITGHVRFNSGVDIYDMLEAASINVFGEGGSIWTPSIDIGQDISIGGGGAGSYGPHDLTVEGQNLGSVLATQDLTFSLAGLASGSWSGSMFKVETNRNHIVLGSTTITARPHFTYNSSTHTYTISADATDENGTVHAVSTTVDSGDQAYRDGQDDASTSYPPNSATFEWFETVGGEPHFRRTSGDFFGRTSRVVYWD